MEKYQNPGNYSVYRFNLGGAPILVKKDLSRNGANVFAKQMRHENDRSQFLVYRGSALKNGFGLSDKGKPQIAV